jgi:hypothetical protein
MLIWERGFHALKNDNIKLLILLGSQNSYIALMYFQIK